MKLTIFTGALRGSPPRRHTVTSAFTLGGLLLLGVLPSLGSRIGETATLP